MLLSDSIETLPFFLDEEYDELCEEGFEVQEQPDSEELSLFRGVKNLFVGYLSLSLRSISVSWRKRFKRRIHTTNMSRHQKMIDDMWHAHILSTNESLAFCNCCNNGDYLHHDPGWLTSHPMGHVICPPSEIILANLTDLSMW